MEELENNEKLEKMDYIQQMWDIGYDLQIALGINPNQMLNLKFKMLNYISAGKINEFMTETTKLYLSSSAAIPDILKKILQAKKIDEKKELMYSFLLGLCGENKNGMIIDKKELFTIKEASEILAVHYETARAYVEEGKLETEEVGKKKLIKRESLLRLLEIRKGI